jgi:vancomycin resistance protein YoaR
MRAFRILIAIFLVAGVAAAALLPGPDRVMGSFVTSLEGRTRGQRDNAVRAAESLDTKVIQPGHVLSFNHIVGSWTPDRGYVRALVSYDGELVNDWGGGVCQTSTTLYNAALLAGLEIVERNRHTWAPKYVPPGLDAAVAQRNIDLRLRNPYPFPVRIRARIEEGSLGFEILGRDKGPMASVTGETRGTVAPTEVYRASQRLPTGSRRIVTHGRPGVRVAVYRTFSHGPKAGRRELVSLDAYPAMGRVILIGE